MRRRFHATTFPVLDSVTLANRCVARPDENVMTAADRVFGK
jgi:hypothetical protein